MHKELTVFFDRLSLILLPSQYSPGLKPCGHHCLRGDLDFSDNQSNARCLVINQPTVYCFQ
jgi:hypothetical protein